MGAFLYNKLNVSTCIHRELWYKQNKAQQSITKLCGIFCKSGPQFNIKMTSYQYRKSHCGDKTILWTSFLHNGISYTVNSLKLRRNERCNADDIFKCIFLKENVWIPTKISLKFVPKGRINNIPALVQITARRCPGDKPLSEPRMESLLTHICVTRPQWVKMTSLYWIGALEVTAQPYTSSMHGSMIQVAISSKILWFMISNLCARLQWNQNTFLIARFMGLTWGPSGADRTLVGPMLAPWTLLPGIIWQQTESTKR